ncbi:N-6 DNA methylase [Nonomuraea sp. NPDC046802]|uniref:N-6 DNA methylase n=1 Tax=Nonomuraea sp. NPDC046802 TaxID=3154919 RepID=UPI0033F6979F
MSDRRTLEHQVAGAAVEAWWRASGDNDIAIPLGVVAALTLVRRPAGYDFEEFILKSTREEFIAVLNELWTMFAVTRPELFIRVATPFFRWLEDEETTENRRAAAHATGRAAVRAGLFQIAGTSEKAIEGDVLGLVYQELRHAKARKEGGDFFTPSDAADLGASLKLKDLSEIRPGMSFLDDQGGTGGMLRATAKILRDNGLDPREMWWYGNDVDPVAVAAMAVNVHVWDLGNQVILGVANILTEPDWYKRAAAEQDRASRYRNMRLAAARSLAMERDFTPKVQPE